MPAILDFVMAEFTIHRILYVLLFITSMLMWWPMVCPDEYRRLSELQKMAYIILSGVLLTPACAMIIFSPNIVIWHLYRSAALGDGINLLYTGRSNGIPGSF